MAQAAPPVAPGVLNIVTDGRTATSITKNNNVTSITTGTVKAGTGFNSFEHFQMGKGTVVDLIVPDQATTLVNLVRGSRVYIDGVLSAYKDGKIGGNIVFADPHGFVVGSHGVMNVGGLSVVTPTPAFMDRLMNAQGAVDPQALGQLIAGEVPISTTGAVVIRGKINATEAVRLSGQSVSVGRSEAEVAARRIAHAAKFASTVNSKSLSTGAGIEVSNGSIRIVAVEDANINGRVSAKGDVSVSARKASFEKNANVSSVSGAARMDIKARDEITIKRGAQFSVASETGPAGRLIVYSGDRLDVEDGARFDASAKAGDAGFVELSAKKTVSIGEVFVDLSARKGKAGTLLIDPADLIIRNNGNAANDASIKSNIITNGGNVILEADNSITIASDGFIDTRMFDRTAGELSATNTSTGNSGTVTLKAPNITIKAGGKILADVVNSATSQYLAGEINLLAETGSGARSITLEAANGQLAGALLRGGNINIKATLETAKAVAGANASATIRLGAGSQIIGNDVVIAAKAVASTFSGIAKTTANVDVAGAISGNTVTIRSEAISKAAYDTLQDLFLTTAQVGLSTLFGLDAGYVSAELESKVTVRSSAALTTRSDLILSATGKMEASDVAIALGKNPVGASAVIGNIKGVTAVDVASGATLNVGNDLTLNASSDTRLNVKTMAVTSGGTVGDMTVSYAKVDVETTANLNRGVNITHARDVAIYAAETNDFTVSAASYALDSGVLAASVAYADIQTKVTAHLGAKIPTSAAVRHVTVLADSDTTDSTFTSSGSVGNGISSLPIKAVTAVTPSGFLERLFAGRLATFSPTGAPKASGALTLTNVKHSASAIVDPESQAVGYAINASGNVAILSRVRDAGVHQNATSTIESNTGALANLTGPALRTGAGLAVAVSFGEYKRESVAQIGAGASIRAANIGVRALTLMPLVNSWTDWSAFGDVLSHVSTDLGVGNTILTSYSRAQSSATGQSLAGSLNYLGVDNDTAAWVGAGARLSQTSTHDSAASKQWTTTPPIGGTVDWTSGVDIQAYTLNETINIAGDFSWMKFWTAIVGADGGSPTASSAGGSLNFTPFRSKTIAGVGAGANISATGNVSVNARTEDRALSVTPTSGQGGGIALNGIANVYTLDNRTSASISNTAFITAGAVNITSSQAVSIFSVAGAMNPAGKASTAVGISVGASLVTAKTQAYVGDNSDDASLFGFDTGSASQPAGQIQTELLNVDAQATGRLMTLAVSAQFSNNTPTGTTAPDNSSYLSSMFTQIGLSSFAQNINASLAANSRAAANAASNTPGSSLSVAGAFALGDVSLTTGAWLQGANVKRLNADSGSVDIQLRAVERTLISTLSGAAAISIALPSASTSAALSGAIAGAYSKSKTFTSIDESVLENIRNTKLQALKGGEFITIGMGMSVVAGYADRLSASVSFAVVKDAVRSTISNSTLTANDSQSVADVQAYQTTSITTGGGSFGFGGFAGFGLALTYVDIADPDDGAAVSASISDSALSGFYDINVEAADASRIISVAGLAGGGADSSGFGGSIVIASNKRSTEALLIGASSAATPKIVAASHAIRVVSSDRRNSAFDTLISSAGGGGGEFGIDFSALMPRYDANGAVMITAAGVFQTGRSNFGASITVNKVATKHTARVANIDVRNAQSALVQAKTTATILSLAVGAGLSTGAFAGVSSFNLNSIANETVALIGGQDSTVGRSKLNVGSVVVDARDESSITSAAGSVALSNSAAAVGLALTSNSIKNTVTAAIQGAKVTAAGTTGDISISAASKANILTIAVGTAVSANVGAAGSSATNVVENEIISTIGSGAEVSAGNNILLGASSQDSVKVVVGAAGVGLQALGAGTSVVVNKIGGKTSAFISGSGTKVDALGSGDAADVDNGELVSPVSLGSADAPDLRTPDLTYKTRQALGLSIISTSRQTIVGQAVTLGVGAAVGGAVTSVTSVIGGETSAFVEDASINAGPDTSQRKSDLFILSKSDTYDRFLISALAGSAGLGGSGAVLKRTISRKTDAHVVGATLGQSASTNGGLGSVEVRAKASQSAMDFVIGGAVGTGVAGAGSLAITEFKAQTIGYLDRGQLFARSLAVTADTATGWFGGLGAMAGSAGTGVAGAVAVAFDRNLTSATIGNATSDTAINVTGSLDVLANSSTTFNSYVLGGAGAGGNSVAGMADVSLLKGETTARLRRVTSTVTLADAINVKAEEQIIIRQKTGSGALALGGMGLGAGLNLVSIATRVNAEIIDSTLTTNGAVAVSSKVNRDIDLVTATLGAGNSAGIGAAVGVLLINAGLSADINSEVSGTLAGLTSSSDGDVSSGVDALLPGLPSRSNASRFNLNNELASLDSGVVARVSGSVLSGRSVTVTATEKDSSSNLATGAGLSPLAGVGAAVSYSQMKSALTAAIDGGRTTAQDVTVQASIGDGDGGGAVRVDAYAGAGGLLAGLGAAVSMGAIDNRVAVRLGGTVTGTNAGKVIVSGTDASSIRSKAVGATVGGKAAIGVSLATADKGGLIYAVTPRGSVFNKFTEINFLTSAEGAVRSEAIAGAGGGLLSGAGVWAKAKDHAVLLSEVGDNELRSRLGLGAATGYSPSFGAQSGKLNIRSSYKPDVYASALGVSVSGSVALGAAVAEASAEVEVLALLDDAVLERPANALLGASNISISADVFKPDDAVSVEARAVAGAGGLNVGASAAVATATSKSKVHARLGSGWVLPAGNVTIAANHRSDQSAYGTGVTLGGMLALGAVVTKAESDVTILAEVGNNVRTAEGGMDAFQLSAYGQEFNYARSIAGAGGALAGTGASARTRGRANVQANIGERALLVADTLSVRSVHESNWRASADTLNASILGASVSDVDNDIVADVTSTIGNSSILVALAQNATACLSGCTPAFEVWTQNLFISKNNEMASVDAAAGGGINGAGATGSTSIKGKSYITLGEDVDFTSGTHPVFHPGSLRLIASSIVSASERAQLQTGGLIQGAGSDFSADVTVENLVQIGAGARILSFGVVDIATFTQAAVSVLSLVNTYGLAAVGSSKSDVKLRSYQDVVVNARVGKTSRIRGYSNVNIGAGRYSGQGYETTLLANAVANGFVQGLIAIPDVTANSAVISSAGSSLAQYALVESAQNVTAGAWQGTPTATATAYGRGYELGFIPVSTGRSDASVDTKHYVLSNGARVEAPDVTINGAIIAGIFSQLDIKITGGDITDANAPLPEGQNEVVWIGNRRYVLTQTSGAPVPIIKFDAFKPLDFIANKFGGAVDLGTKVSSEPVPAFSLGYLYAAGGTVTINANRLVGSGSLTSYGSPKINVQNMTNAYLIISGGAFIPNTPGGQVIFTGSAGRRDVGSISVAEIGNDPGQIIISNSFQRADIYGNGPALFITGAITNLGGLVSITNEKGSLGVTGGDLSAQQLTVNVPNGNFTFVNGIANGMYMAGAAPYSEWDSSIIWPGGNPRNGPPSAKDAANYVAMYYYLMGWGPNQKYVTDDMPLEHKLNLSMYGYAWSDTHTSWLWFGNCQPYHNCPTPAGPTGYQLTSSRNDDENLFKLTPQTLSLTRGWDAANLTGSQSSYQIYGGSVSIKSAIVNINGKISIGKPTNRSVDFGDYLMRVDREEKLLVGFIVGSGYTYYTRKFGGAIVTAETNYEYQSLVAKSWTSIATPRPASTIDLTPSLRVINPEDQLIGAKYDLANKRIILDDVYAFAGGGSLILEGKIISTNLLGNIKLQSGYGQINIRNSLARELVVNDLNVGSAAGLSAIQSKVKIIDLNYANALTTTYLYAPDDGIKIYQTSNGADPIYSGPNATPYTQINGSSVTYKATDGTRFDWYLYAQIKRNLVAGGTPGYRPDYIVSASDWYFSGDSNNPWNYYLSNSKQPTGIVAFDYQNKDVVFKSDVSAEINQTLSTGWGFHNGHYGYENYNDPKGGAITYYTFNHITAATLEIRNSVKADNPFKIDFAGSKTPVINIHSNGSVILNGRLVNPNGETTINSAGGDIRQMSGSTLSTKSLSMEAGGSVTGVNGANAPLRVSMSGDGKLKVLAGVGNINLDIDGSAVVTQVKAGSGSGGNFGDVRIRATGSLTPDPEALPYYAIEGVSNPLFEVEPDGYHISGRNITLISDNGSIGNAGLSGGKRDEFVIRAHAIDTALGRVGGIVTMSAQGDIAFRQFGEDLRVNSIVSKAGDLSIYVQGGMMVSATGQTSSQSLSKSQVDTVIESLQLTKASGSDNRLAAVIAAFEATVNAQAKTYSRLASNGTMGAPLSVADQKIAALYRPLAEAAATLAARNNKSVLQTLTDAQVLAFANQLNRTNGSFILSDAALSVYRPLAAAALGISAPSDQLVREWANAQYHVYADLFTRAYGTNWRSENIFNAAGQDLAVFDRYGSISVDGSNTSRFVLTQDGIDFYRADAKRALNVQTATDQQVQDWAATQYKSLSQSLKYSATEAVKSALSKDAVWSDSQIVSAVDRSALKPASGVIGEGAAHLAARHMQLRVTYGIGNMADPVMITLDDLRAGTLTDKQKAALAFATTPGSVLVVGDLRGTETIVQDLSNLPADFVMKKLRLDQTAPIFINASGHLDVVTQGSVFLQSTSTPNDAGASMRLLSLIAGGDVVLRATQGILVATDANDNKLTGVQIEAPGNLTLAALGAIGSSTNPLTYRIGGKLVSAQSGDDLYLAGLGSRMEVGRIFANGTAMLDAREGLLTGYLPGLTVTAQDVILHAKTGIGAADAPFRVRALHELSGSSDGSVFLISPKLADESAAVDLTVASFVVKGSLSILSAGDLTVKSADVEDGAMQLSAGDDLVVTRAEIKGVAGLLTLTATGALQVKSLLSKADISLSAGDISSVAGAAVETSGKITVVSLGALDIGGLKSGDDLSITSRNDATVRGAVSGGALTIKSNEGAIKVGSLQAEGELKLTSSLATMSVFDDASLVSRSGRIYVDAKAVSMGAGSSLKADGDVSIVTAEASTLSDATSTSGSIEVTAGGNVSVKLAKAATTISLKSTGGTLGVTNVEAAGAVSLISKLGSLTLQDNGYIKSTGSTVTVDAKSAEMKSGSVLTAAGKVLITTAEGLIATSLTSTLDSVEATAGGNASFASVKAKDAITIKSTNGTLGLTNVEAAGAVSLTSKQGALTLQGNSYIKSTGATVTVDAKSFEMKSGSVLTASGKVLMTTAESLVATSVTSTDDGAEATAGGNASFASVKTKGAITIKSTNGTLGLINVEGAGAVSLTSKLGALTLQDNGYIKSTGSTVTVDAKSFEMKSGTVLTASGKVLLTTVETLVATSVTSTDDDVEATAGGNASFASLKAKGAITVKSTNGTLGLTNVEAAGAVSLTSKQGALTLQGNGYIKSTGATVTVDAKSFEMKSGSVLTASGKVLMTTAESLVATSVTSTDDGAEATAGGNASFASVKTKGAIAIKSTNGTLGLTNVEAAGAVSLTSKLGALTLQSNGYIKSTGSTVTVDAKSFEMKSGSVLTASGKVLITTAESLVATSVTSTDDAIEATADGNASFASVNGKGAVTLKSTNGTLNVSNLTTAGAVSLVSKKGALTQELNGTVESTRSTVSVEAKSFEMKSGSLLRGYGNVLINIDETFIASYLQSLLGGVEVTAGGNASFVSVTAKDAITLKSNSGTLGLKNVLTAGAVSITSKQGALTLESGGFIKSTGSTVTVDAKSFEMKSGTVIAASGNVTLTTAETLIATLITSSSGTIEATAGGNASFGIVNASGAVTLKATNGMLSVIDVDRSVAVNVAALQGALAQQRTGAITSTGSTVTVSAKNFEMRSGSVLTASGNVVLNTTEALTASSLTSTLGGVEATAGGNASFVSVKAKDALTLKSNSGTLSVKEIEAAGAVSLTSQQGALTLQDNGYIKSTGSTVTVDAKSFEMKSGTVLTASGKALLTTAETLVATSVTSTDDGVEATAGGNASFASVKAKEGITLKSTGGSLGLTNVEAAGAVSLTSKLGALTLQDNGYIKSTGSTVTVDAKSFEMKNGTVLTASGKVLLTTAETLVATSVTSTDDAVEATAGGNASFASVKAKDGITIKSTNGTLGLTNVEAAGAVSLTSKLGALTLQDNGYIKSTGSTVTVDAKSFEMKNGTVLTASGKVLLTTAETLVATSVTSTDDDVEATAGGNTSFASVKAKDAITIKSTNGTLGLTNVEAAGAVSLTSKQGALTLQDNGYIKSTGSTVTVDAKSFEMKSGTVLTGSGKVLITTLERLVATSVTSTADGVEATAGGNTSFASVKAKDAITIKSTNGTLGLTNVEAAGAVSLTSKQGALTLQDNGYIKSTGSTVTVDAKSFEMKSGTVLTASGKVLITTLERLVATSVTSTADGVEATAGGNTSFASVKAKEGITLKSTGGTLGLTNVEAAGAVSLTSKLGALTLQDNGYIKSTGSTVTVDAKSFEMKGGTVLTGSGKVLITTLETLVATSVTSTDDDVEATAGGNTSFVSVKAKDTITIKSTNGTLGLTNLEAAGAVSLTSKQGALTLQDNGYIKSTGSTVTVDAKSFEMKSGTVLTASGKVLLTTAETLVATSVTSTDDDVEATAGGNTSFASVKAKGAITIKSTNGTLGLTNVEAAGAVSLTSKQGALTLQDNGYIKSTGSTVTVDARSFEMKSGASVFAASLVEIATEDDMIVGRIRSDRQVSGADVSVSLSSRSGFISVNGDAVTNVMATRPKGAISISGAKGIGASRAPLVVDSALIVADSQQGGIYLRVLGDTRLSQMTAATDIEVAGSGRLSFGTVQAANLSFMSETSLSFDELKVEKSLSLSAPELQGRIVQKGSQGPLSVTMTGWNGVPIQQLNVEISAPVLEMPRLTVRKGQLVIDSSEISLKSTWVTEQLAIKTPWEHVLFDNVSAAPSPFHTVHIFPDGKEFNYLQRIHGINTSAFVVSYGLTAEMIGLTIRPGISFVRDWPREPRNGEQFGLSGVLNSSQVLTVLGLPSTIVTKTMGTKSILELPLQGPAVNVGFNYDEYQRLMRVRP